MKFIGFYQGPPSSYGPPCRAAGGIEVSNTWQATGSYAIGDDGQVYALTYKYSDTYTAGAAQKLYWLRITAEVVTL